MYMQLFSMHTFQNTDISCINHLFVNTQNQHAYSKIVLYHKIIAFKIQTFIKKNYILKHYTKQHFLKNENILYLA